MAAKKSAAQPKVSRKATKAVKRAHAPLGKSAEDDKRRTRLVAIAESFPEAEVVRAGATHLSLTVRKKIFGYYTFNHHGDGQIALWCKAEPGVQGDLVAGDPVRYFVPPYLGSRGWVGIRLDIARVNWSELTSLLRRSYQMTAPKALAARAI